MMIWVALMLPLFLSIIGLAIDGGIVFNARRQLQNVADSAARAGAGFIDERRYRDTSGKDLVIARSQARAAASQSLSSQAPDVRATVTADGRRVVVRVWREVPTTFLRLASIETVRVGATGEAGLLRGIWDAE